MNEQDYKTVEAMEKYGGSFVKQLAELARRADPTNLKLIKETWSEYWKQYEEMSESKKEESYILKINKCPKCGGDISSMIEKRMIMCDKQCGFTIHPDKMQKIVADMVSQKIDREHESNNQEELNNL